MSLGLRARIVLIATGAMSFALSAIIAVSGYSFHKEYTRSLQSRSVAIATSLEVQLQRLLQLGLPLANLIGFEEQCLEVVRAYPGIGYAMVVAPDGSVLFHSDGAARGHKLTDPRLLAALRSESSAIARFSLVGQEHHGAVVPVRDARGELQAGVVVDYPAELTTRKAIGMAASNLGVGLLFLGIGTIALVIALSALVTNPLAKLIDTLQEIRHATTDLSRRAAVTAKGDIGRLADAFNGLMDELQSTTVSKSELERALQCCGTPRNAIAASSRPHPAPSSWTAGAGSSS
jgi:hypothetical protein